MKKMKMDAQEMWKKDRAAEANMQLGGNFMHVCWCFSLGGSNKDATRLGAITTRNKKLLVATHSNR